MCFVRNKKTISYSDFLDDDDGKAVISSTLFSINIADDGRFWKKKKQHFYLFQ